MHIVPENRITSVRGPELSRRKGVGIATAILAISLFILCFDNNQFWWIVANTVPATEHPHTVTMIMFTLLFGGLNVVLALAFGRAVFKTIAATLLVVASALGFYMTQFGVAVDTSIIRSVVETDVHEASTLLSAALFWHVALYGLLPALVVVFLPLKTVKWQQELATRATIVAFSIVAPIAAIYADYLEMSFYGQANRQVRLFMNPLYPAYATGQYFRELVVTTTGATPTPASGLARMPQDASTKPLAVVLVLGETARADHWSLNGYARETNPYTARLDVINFPDVTACGTSTADSLPCMFSPLPRSAFDHVTAARRENLLAMVQRTGIDVLWIDNSTGCKNLCDEQDFVSIADAEDPDFCDAYGCYDELLVRELETALDNAPTDSFVVLHERGSHGPTYHLNVPADAKVFFPECTLDTFRDCDDDSLVNAYDNTVLYSDLVLAKVIAYMSTLQATHDVAVLYVSDHGESLGENGLYLHGFPYRLAPDTQKQVPMLMWASRGYFERSRIDPNCLAEHRRETRSHDDIFHTALGMLEIKADDYRPELDLLADCRSSELLSMAVAQAPPADPR